MNRKINYLLVFIVLIFAGSALAIPGVGHVWDNGAGNGEWNDPINWDTDLAFEPNDWAYPDYRTEKYIAFFNEVRQRFAQQCKLKEK